MSFKIFSSIRLGEMLIFFSEEPAIILPSSSPACRNISAPEVAVESGNVVTFPSKELACLKNFEYYH